MSFWDTISSIWSGPGWNETGSWGYLGDLANIFNFNVDQPASYDRYGNLIKGASEVPWYQDRSVLSAVLPTAMTLGAGLLAPDPETPYAQSREGFEAGLASKEKLSAEELAYMRERDATNAEIARYQADASLAAARESAGARIKAGRMAAQANVLAIQEKALAQRLAMRIAAKQGNPALRQQAIAAAGQARQLGAAQAQQGFSGAASNLANIIRR